MVTLPVNTVYTSAAADLRLDQALSWLSAQAPSGRVVVVGATKEAAAHVLREAVRRSGSVVGWCGLTFGRLATALAQPLLAQEDRVPVGTLLLEALCARAISELAEAGRLGRYQVLAQTPGLARAIARTVLELRLADARPPADGLDVLADAFDRLLGEARLADRSIVLRYAIQAARGEGTALAGVPILFLDVRARSVLEEQFIAELAARAPACIATAPVGDDHTLKILGKALSVEPVHLDDREESALRRLQRHLFVEALPPEGDLGDAVGVFSAPGEDRECVEITRHILREAGRGTGFDQMAVLLRAPSLYRAHLEEALRRGGVPAYFAAGVREPDPSGRALLALLACAAERLSARRFAEYLSLSEVPDADPSGAPPPELPSGDQWVPPEADAFPEAVDQAADEPASSALDPDAPVAGGTLRTPHRWERLLVDAAVIGGLDRWHRRLTGLRAALELELSSLEDPEDSRQASVRNRIGDLASFWEYAIPLLEMLDGLREPRTWGAWTQQLSALASRALRRPDRVLSVLAELNPMAPVGPVSLREVRLVLTRRLTELVRLPAAKPYGRVFIGPTEAARGLTFDVVFVPGLAEKIFPQRVAEDPLLRDENRRALDSGLDTNESRIADERLALRIAAGAARRRLVLSFPRLDLELGRPRVPSFYGLEALRAIEGRLPGFEGLLKRAERVGGARIGWPAPASAAEAIDESEYDLALLEQILRLPPEQTTGMARYLLGSNVHLARALRFRADRWRPRWTSADGLADPSDAARKALDEHLLERRAYSATQLQHYAICPYRFLLSAIHNLTPREEPVAVEELDPLQRGSLVHEVLSQLLTRLRDSGLLPVQPANLNPARQALDETLDAVAARYHDDLAPAIERLWTDTVSQVKADIVEMLRRASEDDSGWRPIRLELAFGLRQRGGRDAASTPEPVVLDCGIQLRGAIDAIEEGAAEALRVTDFKTGKDRTKSGLVIGGGAVLQPVLYALAAEKLLGGKRVESGRLYFCTSAGEFSETVVRLDGRARASVGVIAETLERSLENGFLVAAPNSKEACDWCDYVSVCGKGELQRVSRKPKDRLAALAKLRGME